MYEVHYHACLLLSYFTWLYVWALLHLYKLFQISVIALQAILIAPVYLYILYLISLHAFISLNVCSPQIQHANKQSGDMHSSHKHSHSSHINSHMHACAEDNILLKAVSIFWMRLPSQASFLVLSHLLWMKATGSTVGCDLLLIAKIIRGRDCHLGWHTLILRDNLLYYTLKPSVPSGFEV